MAGKLLTYLFLFTSVVLAQEFTASVNESTVGEDDRFKVSLTFSGKNINNLKNFKQPDFPSFLILSGPNQSSSIQIINGAQTASITYNYILQASGTGTFTIGKASIDQNGNTYQSKPITMKIVKGTAQPQQNKNDNRISNEEITKNLFIKAIVDKKKVYKGEQITVTYKLYTRLNIAAQMSINKLPLYMGFWAEELETSSNISFKTEMVNGKQFSVGVLKKAALFPSQSGELEITPFELTVPVQVKGQGRKSVWDDFFGDPFGRTETIEFNAVSNKVKIDVLPLPEKNKPESFTGAVGNLKFDTKINKTSVKTNEALTLNVEISGSGNLKLLELPEINLPSGFEKYEPKISEKINRKEKISGSKSGEFLFVPRVVGIREIPPIEFSYFDPVKKNYITLKSPGYTLNIEQGERIVTTEIVGKEEIQELGADIRFIKTTTGDVRKKERYKITTIGFWVASAVPFVFLVGLLGWKRKNDKLHGNLAKLRYQKARKVAKNRLKLASKLLDSQNHEAFYTELSLALFGYLEDKLHISKSQFTIEKAGDFNVI